MAGSGYGNRVMHVPKVDYGLSLAWLRPRRADEHVVIVGIAVDHAATQMRDCGHDFRFVELQEFFENSALR